MMAILTDLLSSFNQFFQIRAGMLAPKIGHDCLTGSGLYDGVSVPSSDRDFSILHRVQTDSGAHSSSYLMGTVGSLFCGKSDR